MTVLYFFPEELRTPWYMWEQRWNEIQEIRLRVNCPVSIRTISGERFLLNKEGERVIYSDREMELIFRHLCHDSIYAYEEERKQGYMTLTGGHRVGITGEVIRVEQGYIVKYIRYMNIRIAHEVVGIGESIREYMYDGGMPCNSLIISPPAAGKTTLLRDMVRMYADGNGQYRGINVGVIDERGEIAGACRGSASLHCGIRTDIITGGNKRGGVEILVRTFAPEIIAMDEIGSSGDATAVLYAGVSGCAVLATAHGLGVEDAVEKEELRALISQCLFKRYIVLRREADGERTVQIWDGEGRELCGRRQLQQR